MHSHQHISSKIGDRNYREIMVEIHRIAYKPNQQLLDNKDQLIFFNFGLNIRESISAGGPPRNVHRKMP